MTTKSKVPSRKPKAPRGTPRMAHTRASALDLERQDSMADEGGVSAALLDIEDREERKLRHPGAAKKRTWPRVVAIGAGAAFLATIGCVLTGLIQLKA